MVDRRRTARARMLIGARVTFDQGLTSADYAIRNLSDGGARLTIGDRPFLGTDLALQIPRRRLSCKATVRWTDGTSVGVEFEHPSAR